MKKLAISVILVFLFCLSSQAQGLYKFSFQSNNVRYDTLLVWYGSGQPFMRTTFYHPVLKKNVTVQQNVTYNNRGTYETLDGSNPVFLTPVPNTERYYADHYVFQRMQNGFYSCTGVIDDAGQVGTIGEFRVLTAYEVNPSFLQYFAFSPPANVNPNNSSVTMHLIIVANIEDTGIGGNIDAREIQREFRLAANEIGITFKPIVVTGFGFNRTNVVNTLNNLKPNPNDIVVFVYTGHGFRFDDDSDPYPRFDLTRERQTIFGNNLPAYEVYNSLKSKGARLNITIVDACNSKINMNKPDYDEGVVLKPSDAGINGRAVASLFLNTRGNVIVASASKGEKSAGNSVIGGFFIHSFLDAFMYETSIANSSSPSWLTIITNAKSYAYKKSKGNQNAVYYTDLR